MESPNPFSSLQLSLQNYQFERPRGKAAGQVTSGGGRKQQARSRGPLGGVRFRRRPEGVVRRDPRSAMTDRDRTRHPAGGGTPSEGTKQKKKPEGAPRLHLPDSIPNPLEEKRNCVTGLGLAEGDPSSVCWLKKIVITWKSCLFSRNF